MRLIKLMVLLVISGSVLMLSRCDFSDENSVGESSSFLNLHDSVGYVGIQTCCNAIIRSMSVS